MTAEEILKNIRVTVVTGGPQVNSFWENTHVLLAMRKFAEQERIKAFDAARKRLKEGDTYKQKHHYKDYKDFSTQNPLS